MVEGNGKTIESFVELVGQLPLHGSGSSYSTYGDEVLRYEEFFINVYSTSEQGVRQLCQGLQSDRKLVVLLACIWAKVQVGKQSEQNVTRAASEAMALLGDETISIEFLTLILRGNRPSLVHHEVFPEYIDARCYNTDDFAVAAERLLVELVG